MGSEALGFLLNRHALGEVARLVHVVAARGGDVIREQLADDIRQQHPDRRGGCWLFHPGCDGRGSAVAAVDGPVV